MEILAIKKESLGAKDMVYLPTDKLRPRRSESVNNLLEIDLKREIQLLKKDKLFKPLTVERVNSFFQIVAGSRIWRAAKILDIKQLPCVIVEADNLLMTNTSTDVYKDEAENTALAAAALREVREKMKAEGNKMEALDKMQSLREQAKNNNNNLQNRGGSAGAQHPLLPPAEGIADDIVLPENQQENTNKQANKNKHKNTMPGPGRQSAAAKHKITYKEAPKEAPRIRPGAPTPRPPGT